MRRFRVQAEIKSHCGRQLSACRGQAAIESPSAITRHLHGQAAIESPAGRQLAACRGQAAMEFLMTYGWAVLIMLVVVAVLFYSGVFNTGNAIPKSCAFPAGFTCAEFSMDETGVLQLDIGQATGKTINVTGIGCSTNSTPDVTALASPVTIRSGSHAFVTNASGLACAGATAPAFKGKIVVSYTTAGSPLVRNVIGDLSYPVSIGGGPGPTPTPTPVVLMQANLPYTISSPGTYVFGEDLRGLSNYPITVTADGANSTIDCQGHYIRATTGYESIIRVYFTSNVTIKNCVIYAYGGAYAKAIELEQGSDCVIQNNTLSTNIDYSVYMWRDSFRNQLINNQGTQFFVGTWARHNVFTGNIACVSPSNITCEGVSTNTTGSGNQCSASSCAGAPCNSAC